jgi:hypothetical protein
MTTPTKIGCPICKHFLFDGTCAAFPGQYIPFGFVAGIAEHTEPVKGQENDLVFEWISPEEQGIRRSEAIAKSKAANQALV